ncbi:sulfatase-like hydrolase/transferase [Arcticibacterium luteifluviistationis]|uniref:Sulfatase n=1 Tax=Arcticibacterium luteifluviistationis TaxID=1784714 RepID=A0A2Z4GGQ8_9BACT|nr:sulfatase-like hydrolase/transferase [Arcticibacterium luteifluviistationis]AWW00268.1 sulfatase [Arcticibacterium luteifluviistationis]
MAFRHILPALFSVVFLVNCNKDSLKIATETKPSRPNILLLIADDMGKDATFGFSEGSIKPNTPNLNSLKASGLSFSNLWVNPTCSPTRASLITGKYGYRTGVKWAGDILSDTEMVLQNYINQQTNNTYATAVVGKWHLSGNSPNINPESFGIDYFSGIASGTVPDYYNWPLSEDGSSSTQTEYSTAYLTDLGIDWIAKQEKPWFMWMAYNAPHIPFHTPPSHMHSQGTLPEFTNGMDGTPYYMAAIEAMDFEIGRLIAAIPPDELENTIIIFLGDNGTPNQVAQFPYSNRTAKGTLYQGGVNTPMYISGSGVSRTGIDNNLICGTDLFATIANLAGTEVTEINDSKSFVALLTSSSTIRDFQYSEMDDGRTDSWAIRDKTYKLITNANGNQEMYNILTDPYEANDILTGTLNSNQLAAKTALENELQGIRK